MFLRAALHIPLLVRARVPRVLQRVKGDHLGPALATSLVSTYSSDAEPSPHANQVTQPVSVSGSHKAGYQYSLDITISENIGT